MSTSKHVLSKFKKKSFFNVCGNTNLKSGVINVKPNLIFQKKKTVHSNNAYYVVFKLTS